MNVSGETALPWTIEPLSPAIGAEIRGLDLSTPPTGAAGKALRELFNRHHVLVVRDQDLTPAQQLAFAETIGEPDIYPFVDGIEGYPTITAVLKLPDERVNFGGVWHSDTVYLDKPPMATLLLARDLPPVGGDTLFASQVAAYAALSDGLKAVLGRLRAVNASAKPDIARTRAHRLDQGSEEARSTYEAVHPVVRTHPETGVKALYVNRAHTVRFEEMTEAESAPLLEFLFAHQVRPEFCCRVRWRPGTLVLWDNRACQHLPLNDYHDHRRELHRVTLKGDKPA